jgi:methyl coenzyme M reductase alpha subunit
VPNAVSQAFVEGLSSAGCSGWSLFSVTVYDKKGVPASGFHGFQVVGECGPIDLAKVTTRARSIAWRGVSEA